MRTLEHISGILVWMSAPKFRANHTKHSIGHVKRLPEPERTRLLDQLADLRTEVRKASIFDWLDGELHIALADAIVAVLGRGRAIEFWRDVMLDAFSRALLRPIVSGAIAIHGGTPEAMLRMSPRAWSLVAKNGGEISVDADRTARRAVITFRRLPRIMADSPGLLAFFEGALTAVGSHLKVPLRVHSNVSGLERGELHLNVEWT